MMRGFLLSGLVCIMFCVQYATAQALWPKWILNKGVICEERCKQIKNCNPLNEFTDCKCFPRQYVKKWLQYNTLPLDPALVCLMSWSGVVPKCCDIYKKQKDLYKNSELERITQLEKKLGSSQNENEELKKKLGSCEQDDDRSSNLTTNMLNLLAEQGRTQKLEIEQMKKRLDAEEDGRMRLSNLTTNMLTTIGKQDKALDNLTQAWSSEPWKPFATKLVESIRVPSKVGFSAWLSDPTSRLGFYNIAYDKVLTNDGGGYNPSNGVFICPVSGTYLFSYTSNSGSQSGREIQTYLYINSVKYTASSMQPSTTFKQQMQTTNVALLAVKKYDHVAVKLYTTTSRCLTASSRFAANIFTGVLMYT